MHKIYFRRPPTPPHRGDVFYGMSLTISLSISSGVVLFLTGEVIYLWSSGDLKKQQQLAMANLQQLNRTNETTMVSTSTETFLDQ